MSIDDTRKALEDAGLKEEPNSTYFSKTVEIGQPGFSFEVKAWPRPSDRVLLFLFLRREGSKDSLLLAREEVSLRKATSIDEAVSNMFNKSYKALLLSANVAANFSISGGF